MALKHYDVTLGATATVLSSTRKGVLHAIIYNPTGNDTVYVGDSTVSSTSYGIQVAAGTTPREIGPFSGSAPLETDKLYFKGTLNNVVHVLVVTH